MPLFRPVDREQNSKTHINPTLFKTRSKKHLIAFEKNASHSLGGPVRGIPPPEPWYINPCVRSLVTNWKILTEPLSYDG